MLTGVSLRFHLIYPRRVTKMHRSNQTGRSEGGGTLFLLAPDLFLDTLFTLAFGVRKTGPRWLTQWPQADTQVARPLGARPPRPERRCNQAAAWRKGPDPA